MNIKEKVRNLPPWTKHLKWPGIIGLSLLFLMMIGYFIILFGGRFVVEERALVMDELTTVETTDGELIERIYTKNREIVEGAEIPSHVKDAFVAIEDQRFYDHSGVDFRAILRAIYKDILAMEKVEGGSTITQQLSKNLFLTNEKTWMRKTKEVMAAIYLERNYSKDEILALYLNRIYFGEGTYGIQSASKHYFDRPVSDLTVAQAALLAGLPKAPNYYSPFDNPEQSIQRRNLVLSEMEQYGSISVDVMKRMQGSTLAVAQQEELNDNGSNSYVDLVIDEAAERYHMSRDELKRGGYQIVVAMDPVIQKVAAEKMRDGEFVPGDSGPVEGAFTLMDNETGALLAAVGGRNFEHGDLNRTQVKKSPASVIKPLAVYGPALMQGDYRPFSVLSDRKQTFTGGYEPSNYDDQYQGEVSLYQALVESKNVPAVSLLEDIGIDYSKSYLDKLGLSTDDHGLAIALGGLSEGYSPIQLTEAYGSFARDGKKVESYTIEKIVDRYGNVIHEHQQEEVQVFDAQTAWNMTEMLQTTVEEGTANSGEYGKALAGKTGTQQGQGGNKHVWFAGYTPQYSGALWMGYDQSGEGFSIQGSSAYPTRLMKDILSSIDQQQPLTASFEKPEGVEELPKPIRLPELDEVKGSLNLAGLATFRGSLEWTPSSDDRVVYRIYKEEQGEDVRVGEVTGAGSYQVNAFSIFDETNFYVVPYDPLTELEGSPSNRVTLSWDI
ncbi:PBP1A family penicillin-binding protein [Halobacillus litoralis]|uniref:transglycosylase domain-containing protein n=1 Tax=Halobacillus litoralis TaxID=45668 RepID=UPI001CD780B9|nr:PBP1A family penicillin-binding protein [Halobacillus litoralis]MCA0969656.1 PBP1A family penicillin-binding protein [Halobacillus litoralis]